MTRLLGATHRLQVNLAMTYCQTNVLTSEGRLPSAFRRTDEIFIT